MPARYGAIALAVLSGCSAAPDRSRQTAGTEDEAWQGFSLGTMPTRYARAEELRYLVSVPRRYLDPQRARQAAQADRQGRIVANAVRFAVEYPSLAPAPDPWSDGVIRLTIGSLDEDGISATVDGSRVGHYSLFDVDLADAYGLHVRRRADSPPALDDRLYFLLAPDLHVRIECKARLGDTGRWCLLSARRPGEAAVGTGFGEADLPHWRDRLTTLRTLFRSEGRAPLGPMGRRTD